MDFTRSIALQHTIDQEFELRYSIWASGIWYSSNDLHGTLDFQGLPEGVGIISCHGFTTEPLALTPAAWGLTQVEIQAIHAAGSAGMCRPVAIQGTTWSHLKHIYR